MLEPGLMGCTPGCVGVHGIDSSRHDHAEPSMLPPAAFCWHCWQSSAMSAQQGSPRMLHRVALGKVARVLAVVNVLLMLVASENLTMTVELDKLQCRYHCHIFVKIMSYIYLFGWLSSWELDFCSPCLVASAVMLPHGKCIFHVALVLASGVLAK